MKEFLLLFRGGDEQRAEEQKDPAKWEAYMDRWRAWRRKLNEEGKFISGLPLGADGAVVAGSNKIITDGPFTEGKEIVGGFVIIKAEDKAEAVEISKVCPLLEHEAIIEVRELKTLPF